MWNKLGAGVLTFVVIFLIVFKLAIVVGLFIGALFIIKAIFGL